MSDKFRLYIKTDGKYIRYGVGDRYYIDELIYDFVIKNKLYNQDEVEFRIERLNYE